jgi:hypothetical protein
MSGQAGQDRAPQEMQVEGEDVAVANPSGM